MTDYLKYFFNLNHLLNLRPEPLHSRAIIAGVIIFGALVLLGVACKIMSRATKDGLKIKGYRKFFNLFLTMGLIGFVYLFFAWQGVVLLSSRLVLLAWAIISVIWLLFILKYIIIEVPKTRKQLQARRQFEKYLP
ncbi:MAG: hypothetical protein PHW95_03890 [Patescibacteria group bacterium]|nr:hypothetical protein [Patescibacteria group bacterium]